MVSDVKVLAIIPARGGSKGIKDKNIKRLSGAPLLSYSIEAAVRSQIITKIICSTDSKDIANVAKKFGAEVPFFRPKEISQDTSTDIEYCLHAIEWLQENESYTPDLIIQLRPTSPLRTIKMIEDAIMIMINNSSYDSLRAISEPDHTPYKMWKLLEKNKMEQLLYLKDIIEPYNMNRQLLPKTYAQTGSIDITRTRTITEQNSMTGRNIYPYIIDEKYFIDIDTIESLELAELRMKRIDCIKFSQ
jgi:CMP-N,N'-diacetyllegionaminic acid synthase